MQRASESSLLWYINWNYKFLQSYTTYLKHMYSCTSVFPLLLLACVCVYLQSCVLVFCDMLSPLSRICAYDYSYDGINCLLSVFLQLYIRNIHFIGRLFCVSSFSLMCKYMSSIVSLYCLSLIWTPKCSIRGKVLFGLHPRQLVCHEKLSWKSDLERLGLRLMPGRARSKQALSSSLSR